MSAHGRLPDHPSRRRPPAGCGAAPGLQPFAPDCRRRRSSRHRQHGRPQDWSSDGGRLWYDVAGGVASSLLLLDVVSGQKHEYVRHPTAQIYRPTFSPDGRWISLRAQTSVLGRTIYAVPLHGEAPVSQSEWVAVTDGASMDREPNWSADG